MAFSFDFKSILVNPVRTVLVSLRTALDTITNMFGVVQETIADAQAIYEEIQTFEIDPTWQFRVVSAPQAVDNVKNLSRAPARIVVAIRDLINRVKESFGQFKNPVQEAAAAAEEAGSLEGGILRIFPRLTALLGRVATRILAAVGLLVQILVDTSNAINDIHVIVRELRTIIHDLNRLNAVFLQQSNRRKTVTLEDGSTMRIRVGHLHPDQ